MLSSNEIEPKPSEHQWDAFPQTRYLGSKRKLLGLLAHVFERIEFDTVLDPFCGTGAVAYLLKAMNKKVTASDMLESNAVVARALVENSRVILGTGIDELCSGLPDTFARPGFVEQTFDEIFFERDENRFIDQILGRIHSLDDCRRDLALFALFQACLAKRPYNLFHRANLYMRRSEVRRSFGNKKTWDTSFAELMRRFAAEADLAVFDTGQTCRAFTADVLTIDPCDYDLVYLDPPYVSSNGSGVDYLDYYHFLEGLCRPSNWADRLLHKYKHKPLMGRGQSPWCDSSRVAAAFRAAIEKYRDAVLVISYRSDGIPNTDEIIALLKKAKKRVELIDAGRYKYALSRNQLSREIVLVGL